MSELNVSLQHLILTLAAQGWSNRRIARELGLHRETVLTIVITGRSYRLKDNAAIAGKEDKNKKIKSKSNEPSTAEPAS